MCEINWRFLTNSLTIQTNSFSHLKKRVVKDGNEFQKKLTRQATL
jgi:hypothetical protein